MCHFVTVITAKEIHVQNVNINSLCLQQMGVYVLCGVTFAVSGQRTYSVGSVLTRVVQALYMVMPIARTIISRVIK